MTQYAFVGTCSLCGGDVVVPSGPWASVVPPRPHCQDCGAQAAKGPVIDVVPAGARECVGPCFCTGACHGRQSSGTTFIGPGLVPYKTEMTQLDPEAAKLLADHAFDLYTRS